VSFRDAFDKVIIRLGQIKQEVFDNRSKFESLYYENERLNLRAAAGFDNLTPRPDYKKLLEHNNFIEMEIFDAGKKQIIPTQRIVESLFNQMRDANEKLTKLGSSVSRKPNIKITTDMARRRGSSINTPRGSKILQESPKIQKSSFARKESRKDDDNKKSEELKMEIPDDDDDKRSVVEFNTNSPMEKKRTNLSNTSGGSPSETGSINKNFISKPSNVSILNNQSTPKSDKIKIEFSDVKLSSQYGEETVKKADDLVEEVIATKKLIEDLEAVVNFKTK
jgi:hypothetical protein